MNKQKLIERVQKLMAMAADGSSPNEAMIAARRARKLMDEHQLTVEDLTSRSEFSVGKSSAARRFTPHWENILCVAVAELNDCLATLKWQGETMNGVMSSLTFKGFDEDVAVAKYMFAYLVENGKRQCSKYMKDKGYTRYNAKVGTAFKDAYSKEVCVKINQIINERKAEAETGKGLMIVKKQLVEQEFGEAKYKTQKRKVAKDHKSQDAREKGKVAGENTPIHTGLKETKTGAIAQ